MYDHEESRKGKDRENKIIFYFIHFWNSKTKKLKCIYYFAKSKGYLNNCKKRSCASWWFYYQKSRIYKLIHYDKGILALIIYEFSLTEPIFLFILKKLYYKFPLHLCLFHYEITPWRSKSHFFPNIQVSRLVIYCVSCAIICFKYLPYHWMT